MEVTDMIWYLNGFLGEKKSKKNASEKVRQKQVIQKGLADMCMLQVPFRLPESFCAKIIKKITRKFLLKGLQKVVLVLF